MAAMILATATVTGTGGYAQLRTRAGHELRSDERESSGETTNGRSSTETMLASLGARNYITKRMYAERKQCDLGGIGVTVGQVKNGDAPPHIERKISVAGDME